MQSSGRWCCPCLIRMTAAWCPCIMHTHTHTECSPKEALVFALDAQLKLLHLPWPPGLLELPAWQAVYVKGRSNDELLLSWQDIIDPDTSDSVPDSPIGSLLRRVKARPSKAAFQAALAAINRLQLRSVLHHR
ncbi:hypothetical protein HaLaN_19476 [Haematococcus lacustris]|uniref:Uncharacterized protein n=1 Tax=Haematococcus lacustris TaxID=44745 RepID=A0A699ZQX3_HAELA|nr:hypothetical protein HaLaN_19476 [Haematococcus lacustris]